MVFNPNSEFIQNLAMDAGVYPDVFEKNYMKFPKFDFEISTATALAYTLVRTDEHMPSAIFWANFMLPGFNKEFDEFQHKYSSRQAVACSRLEMARFMHGLRNLEDNLNTSRLENLTESPVHLSLIGMAVTIARYARIGLPGAVTAACILCDLSYRGVVDYMGERLSEYRMTFEDFAEIISEADRRLNFGTRIPLLRKYVYQDYSAIIETFFDFRLRRISIPGLLFKAVYHHNVDSEEILLPNTPVSNTPFFLATTENVRRQLAALEQGANNSQ